MNQQPYSQMIRYKQWADRGLHEVVTANIDRLSAEESSIVVRILDHIHVVDQIFQHHLQGRRHSFTAARSTMMPDIEQLMSGTQDLGAWYVPHVEMMSPQDFDKPVDFVFTSGKPMHMTCGEIILHVCMHGTYHRGNAGILFQKNGIAPNRDGITDYLEAAA
jgi:uncharacterized damage-inducible protein DinB